MGCRASSSVDVSLYHGLGSNFKVASCPFFSFPGSVWPRSGLIGQSHFFFSSSFFNPLTLIQPLDDCWGKHKFFFQSERERETDRDRERQRQRETLKIE